MNTIGKSPLVQYVETIANLKAGILQPTEATKKPPLVEAVLSDACLEQLFLSFDKINRNHKFKGPLGYCYKTAYNIAAMDPDYVYCEGYATSKQLSIPLMHAWCVHRKTNEVYDGVWNKRKTTGNAYCGIPLRLDFVTDCILNTKHYGVIDHLWMQRELLNTPLTSVIHPDYQDRIYAKF